LKGDSKTDFPVQTLNHPLARYVGSQPGEAFSRAGRNQLGGAPVLPMYER
jgi:hypothetical protein